MPHLLFSGSETGSQSILRQARDHVYMDQAQNVVQIVPSLLSKKTATQSNLNTALVAKKGHVIRYLEKEIFFSRAEQQEKHTGNRFAQLHISFHIS